MQRLTLPTNRRYLVRFAPKVVSHTFADVLIVGSGIAGLRAALAVDPSLSVLIVTKDALEESNSTYAQGGIAGVLDPLDRVADHAADTIAAGKGLCDETVVAAVTAEAPGLIRELVERGVELDRVEGQIALTQEGGHSHRRIAHALGDATGKEVIRAMCECVRRRDALRIWEHTFTIDLVTYEGVCRGALVSDQRYGRTCVWAKQTILATGGAGQLFRETTNPSIATADGHAIAFRAGAELRDMEFMQFHPTVLYIAGSSRHLISEAVRGEGAHLVDCHGRRFMADYAEAGELAPRDVVSRAITDQMDKTRHPCAYLDLSHLDSQVVAQRFPHIGGVCAEFGLDISSDRIPVRPGAHYMIGGVIVDESGCTNLPHLRAAGEVTASGLHGANRLGSNSLLEGLAFGLRAGRGASESALAMPDDFTVPSLGADWQSTTRDDDHLNLVDLRNALNSLMWRHVGIRRNAEGLAEAERQVEFWSRYVSTREFYETAGWELQNLLLASRLMIAGALARTESRGVHFRSDYPDVDPRQASHINLCAGC